MNDILTSPRSGHGAFIVDRRGTILGFDMALENLTGWPAVEIVGHHKDLTRPAGQCVGAGPRSLMTVPLYDGEIPLDSQEHLSLTLHCRDGRSLYVEAAAEQLLSPGDRALVRVTRVLASSGARSRFPGVERFDPLTGLPDRDAFGAQLSAAFRSASIASTPLALVLIDVDHLREINDRLGRVQGDSVLRQLAAILRVTVEDERALARLGADDFAVLLRDAGRGEARQVAASLRSAVERYQFFANDPINDAPRVTISLGAASFPADAESETELMERTREALQEARNMGRNRVWCYVRRPRVPLEVPVFFDSIDPLFVGYARDLSPSGIFVQTAASIDIGMRCALAFPLPGHEGKVHVVGRVVRTVRPAPLEANPSAHAPGLGVEFERFGGATDRRAIELYLHEHESQTLRPETGRLSTGPGGRGSRNDDSGF